MDCDLANGIIMQLFGLLELVMQIKQKKRIRNCSLQSSTNFASSICHNFGIEFLLFCVYVKKTHQAGPD